MASPVVLLRRRVTEDGKHRAPRVQDHCTRLPRGACVEAVSVFGFGFQFSGLMLAFVTRFSRGSQLWDFGLGFRV
jgi:hypothetical protein